MLAVALSVRHLLRIRSRRVTRRTGRFVERAVRSKVRLNSEQTFNYEPQAWVAPANVTGLASKLCVRWPEFDGVFRLRCVA
jgi:hypothetical protein